MVLAEIEQRRYLRAAANVWFQADNSIIPVRRNRLSLLEQIEGRSAEITTHRAARSS